MQELFDQHLHEVQEHYASGDHDLGLRRLLDCAIETENAQIFKEVLDFCTYLESIEKSTISHERVVKLLELIGNAGFKSRENKSTDVLSMSQVAKRYKKSGFAISSINFDLELGNIMGLVGENGNGKTTLLRLIAGELKADSGSISYPFADDYSDNYDLKTKLIYIEQRIPRWHGSLMDNLQYTTAHYHENAEDNILWTEMMIARLGLRPFKHLTWGRISSGYRTRFELAKTLLRRPKLLLLDEPLANLDIVAQQTILQDLKFMSNSIASPFAMILSSQHIYEVEKVSDSIMFIRNGEAQWEKKSNSETATDAALILEMEVNVDREALKTALSALNLLKVQYNGGVFLLHLSAEYSSSQVLSELAKHQVEVLYFRNISQSSRRFFIQ